MSGLSPEGGRRPINFEPEVIEPRRVVVTGIGAVTPVGRSAHGSFNNIIAGHSGVQLLREPIPNTRIQVAAPVPDWDPVRELQPLLDESPRLAEKELKNYGRTVQFMLHAADEALQDAGLLNEKHRIDENKVDPERAGTIMGTGFGGAFELATVKDILDKGEQRPKPEHLLVTLPDRTGSVPSMKFGLKGPLQVTTDACATGALAIHIGADQIRLGEAEVMLVGGTEAAINQFAHSLFDTIRAVAYMENDPVRASRPFDVTRKGFVMGEGAAALVLEDRNHAIARGARTYAELFAYGGTADANHPTAPSGEGSVRAMRLATRGELLFELVADGQVYANAHATSTPSGDDVEMKGIKEIVPERDRDRTPISSTKWATGHLVAAGGAFEAIVAIKAINEGVVPGNNYTDVFIAEAEGMNTPRVATRADVRAAINNSFGFGGINATDAWIEHTPPVELIEGQSAEFEYSEDWE